MKRGLFIVFLFPVLLLAQKPFALEITSSDHPEVLSGITYKKTFSSKTDLNNEVRKVLFTLYDNAYLTAETENITTDKDDSLKIMAVIRTGSIYQWASLRKGNIDESILKEINSPLLRRGVRGEAKKPFSYKETRRVQEKILTWCENHGYPFASVKLDSLIITNSSISAALNLQKNTLIKIDSVVNRGDAKISEAYLQSYLGIRSKDLYNEEAIKKIGTRIKEIPFVKERIPYRVVFPGGNAKVELFLEKKRASAFEGILGLLPDNKTGKILFTGDVRLRLNNSFNRGEFLDLNWRRLQASTQDLKTRFIFPFLFKTPFGIDASFKLYKKDSTYLEVNPNIGIQYHLSGGNYFKVFMNRKQMTLINTKGLQYVTTLPPYADITSSLYGISLHSEKLDYRLNPRKGYSVMTSLSAGNKVIKKNDKLNEAVYTGLKLNSAQYNADLEGNYFIPLKERSTLRIGNRSAYLQNSTLFQNELFRIGGLQSLRGFDEESIPTSQYSIFTLEYRFLFEENSYLFFFGEGGYYENHSVSFTGDRYDAPYGFGAGISFQTKAGIFAINYALGSQFNNPIDIRAGKVHFGIVNYF